MSHTEQKKEEEEWREETAQTEGGRKDEQDDIHLEFNASQSRRLYPGQTNLLSKTTNEQDMRLMTLGLTGEREGGEGGSGDIQDRRAG